MAACSACGKTILFGGVREAGMRFCSDDCRAAAAVAIAAREVPEDAVARATQAVHQGLCPQCGGSGPVDVHASHTVWSLLLITQWRSVPRISCRSCGLRQQIGGFFFSLLLGWWGFPWGFLMTPVQLVRNVAGMVKPPDPMHPSAELAEHVRMMVAEQALEDAKPAAR